MEKQKDSAGCFVNIPELFSSLPYSGSPPKGESGPRKKYCFFPVLMVQYKIYILIFLFKNVCFMGVGRAEKTLQLGFFGGKTC